MQCKDLVLLGGISLGGVLAYMIFEPNGVLNMKKLGAKHKWELEGYLNGLVRGGGSSTSAKVQLGRWQTYWVELHPEMENIINEWFLYGLERVEILYGE